MRDAASAAGTGQEPRRTLGRYCLYDAIASGGMAAVHLGRLVGAAGFSRIVAIKRMHAHLARDPNFVTMFIDEARMAARVRHPNVVQTLDVASVDDELFVVLEYVHGVSLSQLGRLGRTAELTIPPPIALRIVCDLLLGLHAAHEANNERGEPLGLVHRDVSPHNVLVGADGVGRVLDFGIAKALGRMQVSAEGELKGKVAYIAPEQLRGEQVDRRVDVYAASVVLWEALAGRQLFDGTNEAAVLAAVLENRIPSLRAVRPEVTPELESVVRRGTSLDPAQRWTTAAEMAEALERVLQPASARDVSAWVTRVAERVLAKRSAIVARIESNAPDPVPTEIDITPTGPRTSTMPRARMAVSAEIVSDPASASRRAAIWGVLGGFLGAFLLVGALLFRSNTTSEPPRPAAGPDPSETKPAEVATAPPPSAAPAGSPSVDVNGPAVAPTSSSSTAPAVRRPPRRPPPGTAQPTAAPEPERPDDLFGRN